MPKVTSQINFYSDGIKFTLRDKIKVRAWLKRIAKSHSFSIDSLVYVFKSDDGLLAMNRQFLNHNTLTDIITFPGDAPSGAVAGEIYISIDRVRENAKEFDEHFKDELSRVMAHGLLHLCGFKDKTTAQAKRMRLEEKKALDLRTN
ncbi:MAG: rRNA maturation RNase YbeY [Bacteroidota bacterium]|jgi:rRNA maturation RNase YbeY